MPGTNRPAGTTRPRGRWGIAALSRGCYRVLSMMGHDLVTIDVSAPAQTRILDRLHSTGSPDPVVDATQVGQRSALLFEERLDLYDLPAVGSPMRVATGKPRMLGCRLAVRDDCLHVADSLAGVTVWHLPADLTVPPTPDKHAMARISAVGRCPGLPGIPRPAVAVAASFAGPLHSPAVEVKATSRPHSSPAVCRRAVTVRVPAPSG